MRGRATGGPAAGQRMAAVQAALAAEQAASYGYGVVGANLTGAKLAAATADWIGHQRARDALTAMVLAMRGQPHAAAAAYQLPVAVTGPASAAALAAELEQRVAAGYLAMVALDDRALRKLGAERMQAAAVRATRWSGRTEAFPGWPAQPVS